MQQFIRFALAFPGNRGINVLRPQPGGTREYTVVDRFAGWFTPPDTARASAPSQTKMALGTFLGVYPLTSSLPPLFAWLLPSW